MPALVIWERSCIAGDELRFISMLSFLYRIVQTALLSYYLHMLLSAEHDPASLLRASCLISDVQYYIKHSFVITGASVLLLCSISTAALDVVTFVISGRGTPTQPRVRKLLSPLCKVYMIPLLLLRIIGFIFLILALEKMDNVCQCIYQQTTTDVTLAVAVVLPYCPGTAVRENFIRYLILCFVAFDVLVPSVTLLIITRHAIYYKLYRRYVRPDQRERSLEELQQSWQATCRRSCECCAVMTCFIFGGCKATSGSYADVAIALTDFLDGDGTLDIVASDIAAALICLVNEQKKKQIEVKNRLLQDGGIFAKDRTLIGTIWKQFINSDDIILPTFLHHGHNNNAAASNTIEADIENGVVVQQQQQQQQQNDGEDEVKDEHDTFASNILNLESDNIEGLRKIIMARSQLNQDISLRLIEKDHHMSFEPTVNRIVSSQNPFDCLLLAEGSRYSQVAVASYTWMMYIWRKKCTGCCQLTANSIHQCCTCHLRYCRSSNQNQNMIGGTIFGWDEVAVLQSLGIQESNLLYANFSNDVGVSPYLIIRDDKWKTIVIAIRGTLTLEDMITDVTLTPVSLDETGQKFGFEGRDEYCHGGILACALSIHDDLMRHNLLGTTFEAHPDFGLRIIGHSLGGGVAAMLGRILKQQYSKLYCLCFSPPGCVFTERTAKESMAYCCSYVLHNDIVPRLSYESLVNLRNDLVEMISRIKCPKHQIFDDMFIFKRESDVLSYEDKHLHPKNEIPPSSFHSSFEQFKSKQRHRQGMRMTIPGRIMRMIRVSTKLDNVPCWPLPRIAACIVSCGIRHETFKYKMVWTDPKDLAEIFISPTMITDHFPYNVAHALMVAAESYGVADRETNLQSQDQLDNLLHKAEIEKVE